MDEPADLSAELDALRAALETRHERAVNGVVGVLLALGALAHGANHLSGMWSPLVSPLGTVLPQAGGSAAALWLFWYLGRKPPYSRRRKYWITALHAVVPSLAACFLIAANPTLVVPVVFPALVFSIVIVSSALRFSRGCVLLAGAICVVVQGWIGWQAPAPMKLPLTIATVLALGGITVVTCFVVSGFLSLSHDRAAAASRLRRLEELEAHADLSDPLVMTVLGPYRVVERLGMGGMATVYRGIPEASLDEREAVALKVMHNDPDRDADFRRRFMREINLSMALSHPNIVRVIDWGEQDGLLYLAMELIQGEPLTGRIPPGGMAVDQAMEHLRPILDGLVFAHDHGVIHRDLKPDNLMVDATGRVRIMDFGLAKSHDVSKITRTGTAMGTPAYIPPEQFTGGTLDQRSDQYSLGVVFYQMLAGRLPFDGQDTMVILFKHMSEPPPPLRTHRPDLPEAVEVVVMRMMEKDGAARYPDLRAVRQALEEAVGMTPVRS